MIKWFIIGGIVGIAFLETLSNAKRWREINAEVLEELLPTENSEMSIIQLMKDYLDGKEMPKRIRYGMMVSGYQYFRWDAENEEYVCETDEHCFLQVPWHHLRDFVEIVE